MKVTPIKDYLYCKKINQDKTTPSGIILSDATALNLPLFAEVISVGDLVEQFKPGLKIVYKSYQQYELYEEKKDTFLVHQDDIIGIVED